MNEPLAITLSVLGIIGSLGGLAAWFSRSRGLQTINLLEKNIEAYKDSEKLKDDRIAYLEGQLLVKDETIKRLLSDGKGNKKGR